MPCQFAVDDRVVHKTKGPGTVTVVIGSPPDCAYSVALDGGSSVIAVDSELSPEGSRGVGTSRGGGSPPSKPPKQKAKKPKKPRSDR
jgi:hypothetical protein